MKETWTYAKTMPEWPHEYIIRDNVDEELFEKLVIHIRKNGKKEMFYQKDMNGKQQFTAELVAMVALTAQGNIMLNKLKRSKSG